MRWSRNDRRWRRGWSISLIIGMLSLGSCAGKSLPNFQSETRNRCYLSVVNLEDLVLVRQWAPLAEPGDRLITSECDSARDEELMNLTRRLLRQSTNP